MFIFWIYVKSESKFYWSKRKGTNDSRVFLSSRGLCNPKMCEMLRRFTQHPSSAVTVQQNWNGSLKTWHLKFKLWKIIGMPPTVVSFRRIINTENIYKYKLWLVMIGRILLLSKSNAKLRLCFVPEVLTWNLHLNILW